jgi:fido (protein-threonine AMPylation protein)
VFEAVDRRVEEINAHRPFSPEHVARLREAVHPWFIYNSNAIEGNTLSFKETQFYLDTGLLVGGKREDEIREVRNHRDALAEVWRHAEMEDLSEVLVRHLHLLLTQGLRDHEYAPGRYKTRDNSVTLSDGTLFHHTSHVAVPAEMEALLEACRAAQGRLHPAELAARFHYRFILIHPFLDGNGRMARLLANFILLRNQYVPLVVRADRRPAYLTALEAADRSVPAPERVPGNDAIDLRPFLLFVEGELTAVADLYLEVLSGRRLVRPDDVRRRLETLEDAAKGRSLAADPEGELRQRNRRVLERVVHEVRTMLSEQVEGFMGPTRALAALGHFFNAVERHIGE